MTLEQSIDVFIQGFCFARSFAHPYAVEQVGRIRVMRDGSRTSGHYRTEEFVVHGVCAEETLRSILEFGPRRFAVSVIHGLEVDPLQVRTEFKAQGFRALRSEPFFRNSDSQIARFESPLPIRRILAAEDAAKVRVAAKNHSQILPEHLAEDAPLRVSAAFDGSAAVGWVRSGDADYDATWVSNMEVIPSYRRRGLGRALMSTMLAEDRALGRKHSVLLASTAGSKLYPLVGYERIGTLQLYAPGPDLKRRIFGK